MILSLFLSTEEQIFNNLSLGDLWKSLSGYGWLQIVFLIIFFAMVFVVFLSLVFRKQIEKKLNEKNDEKYSSYPWPSEEKISIHNLTDKLAKTEKEAKEFKEMLLHEIERLRKENVSGKQYLIDMSKTIYMSAAIRKMFKELAVESIKLNIVRLIYVIPPVRKSKRLNDTEKFYLDMKTFCKRENRPGSFAIKEGKNIKLFN